MGQVQFLEPRCVLVVMGMQILALGEYVGLVIQFQPIFINIVLNARLQTLRFDGMVVAGISCVAASHSIYNLYH